MIDLPAAQAVEALRAAGATVATAESLTGGMLVSALVSVPGASEVVRGGVVAYAAEVKTGLLGVDPQVVAQYGTVHSETATSMALRVIEACDSTYGVATTGVAGPDPSEGQPPGTVFIAVASPHGVEARRFEFTGDRQEIRMTTVVQALSLLVARVREETGSSQR